MVRLDNFLNHPEVEYRVNKPVFVLIAGAVSTSKHAGPSSRRSVLIRAFDVLSRCIFLNYMVEEGIIEELCLPFIHYHPPCVFGLCIR